MRISLWLILRKFSNKIVEKIKTRILCSVTFFRKSCRLGNSVRNVVEPERLHKTIWRSFACWIIKATHASTRPRRALHFPLHTHTHTHTEIYNTNCFLMTTVVSWTRLNFVSPLLLFVSPASFCLTILGVEITHKDTVTRAMTPLEEWSATRRGLYLQQHTTLTLAFRTFANAPKDGGILLSNSFVFCSFLKRLSLDVCHCCIQWPISPVQGVLSMLYKIHSLRSEFGSWRSQNV
jgi:hypothetical protein